MPNYKEAISLFELNQTIQLELKTSFDNAYWVVGEINELKANYSGHCYIELIEKDQHTDKLIAKSRATIWAGTYRKLLPYFETTAKHAFCEGIKVMVRATVEFHELYGLSLNIIDIDPAYTIGDLQQQKQQAIDKLKEEGVFSMNKELEMPLVMQKIAIISSKKAAGYGDFINQLDNNDNGYVFYTKLFPAVMQGESAEDSVIDALERIYQYEDFFDVVVIIRGGGSKTDLSCFDKYWLAFHVAQFPLPVLTGIGHEQDDTVADMIAHTKLKTPTAVAAFILEKAHLLDKLLDEKYWDMQELVKEQLVNWNHKLQKFSSQIASTVKQTLSRQNEKQAALSHIIQNSLKQAFNHHKEKLEGLYKETSHASFNSLKIKHYHQVQYKKMLHTRLGFYIKNKTTTISNYGSLVKAYDPQNVLNRGYSITLHNGKLVKDADTINEGDTIETRLKKGKLTSNVIKQK